MTIKIEKQLIPLYKACDLEQSETFFLEGRYYLVLSPDMSKGNTRAVDLLTGEVYFTDGSNKWNSVEKCEFSLRREK